MWAIQQYDGKVVNGRKLKVNKFVEKVSNKRPHRTHLFKINEMNDMDEDLDTDQTANGNTTQYNSIQGEIQAIY